MPDLSQYSSIIPEEHLPALTNCLRKIPDFTWLLAQPHPELDRLQGDLLKDFPTVCLDNTGNPRSHRFTVMVLNNSCDLPEGRVDFVTAAPVVDFNKYLEFERKKRSEESLRGYAEAIRKNDKTELFYLPPFNGFPHGAIVLLHLVCSVSASIYRGALEGGNRVASFTQPGFYFLLIKVTTHLARPESEEATRVMVN